MNSEQNTKHGECLSDETLTDFLEGTLDPIVQATCEAHLIACEVCRKKLAGYMRILQPQVTAEEESQIQSIAAAWNQRHSGVTTDQKPRAGSRTAWYVGAAAALLILIVGAGRMILHWNAPSAHELVLAMLTKDRPFPSQLSDEPYVEIRRTAEDGAANNFDSLSTAMSQRAATQYDLGRFHLIQKHFTDAIKDLEDAARDPKATAAVHNDLGVAYMEQHMPDDMIRAEQEFKYALDLDPQFTPAVFNLCLFYEQVNMPELAKKERELYLRLDSTSKWADEVRLRMRP